LSKPSRSIESIEVTASIYVFWNVERGRNKREAVGEGKFPQGISPYRRNYISN